MPKDAYYRNLDSQQVSGLNSGGGRIDPLVQVGLKPIPKGCFLEVDQMRWVSEFP